jgi:hypothetical protein
LAGVGDPIRDSNARLEGTLMRFASNVLYCVPTTSY